MNELENEYEVYLRKMNIHLLRNVARLVGVYKPTLGTKEILIERTVDVLMGRIAPVAPSKRGAPLKDDFVDPKIMEGLKRIADRYAVVGFGSNINEKGLRSTNDPMSTYYKPVYSGVLELLPNGCGYIRIDGFSATVGEDVFISPASVLEYGLKVGDRVVCHAERREDNNYPVFTEMMSVNADANYKNRKDFQMLLALYPKQCFRLSSVVDKARLRYIDLFSPIGKGQRVLVKAENGNGISLIIDLFRAFERVDGNGNIHPVLLLTSARPEDLTEIRSRIDENAEIAVSTFDMSASEQLNVALLALERVKRIAESGGDAILIVDSLTKLTKLADSVMDGGKQLLCGLSSKAFEVGGNILFAARNLERGSVTVIALCSDKEDDISKTVYAEFEQVCNSFIVLTRDGRLDLGKSFTERVQELHTERELACVDKIVEKINKGEAKAVLSVIETATCISEILDKIEQL